MPQWDFLDFLAGNAAAYPNFTLLHAGRRAGPEAGRVVGVAADGPDATRGATRPVMGASALPSVAYPPQKPAAPRVWACASPFMLDTVVPVGGRHGDRGTSRGT